MSLKQEIETWVTALGHYDNNEFEESLKTFDNISDTSKILFNCGVIHATLGEHDKAVECYQRAVKLDSYLAVAYFQQGVSNFLVGDFEEALANFNDTLLYLRGNTFIDYEQLGLKFKLFSCEVLFNRGLCYIYLQQMEAGMADLGFAVKEKVTPDHDVIDEAIREEAEGYTVFSIPVGIIYRPNSAKVKNLKTKDYLGKARLVAASDQANAFTGFAGSEAKKNAAGGAGRDDRPLDTISFAASNLVKTDLPSRARQQSAPPVNRNMFPPTPPPDTEPLRPQLATMNTSPAVNPPPMSARANSVKSGPRPERLNILRQDSNLSRQEPAPFEQQDSSFSNDLPRRGTTRTASEPRGPSRQPPLHGNHPLRDAGDDADIDEYPDELYEMYGSPTNSNRYGGGSQRRHSSRRRERSRSRRRPQYISEEDEDDDFGPSNTSSLSDFEILNNAGDACLVRRRRGRATEIGIARAQPEMKNVRVKVHNADDTRYVMVGSAVVFEDFVDRVREKFGVRTRFKLKVKDEGDFITLGDGDDWDMSLGNVRKEAGREGAELGKMEVWIQEVS
ncbi:NADPH oxidase regulator [Physcia stellaris]|nr:NADPH oxidase regulator [Physcia stellaris]